jgi:phytoene synthase
MEESRTITRRSASNLALAFILLPRGKRDAMSALYAFWREVDDVADDESVPVQERRRRLNDWRDDLSRTYGGITPQRRVLRELQPVIQQYPLAAAHFEALLQGVEMDLEVRRYPDYEALDLYCYRVASVVGLLSIEIFGYTNPACRDYAVYLGKALQLTNILRDVRGDAERGRIYLPLSELARQGVAPEEILRFEYSDRFYEAARAVSLKARQFYRLARETLPAADCRAMIAAELMATVYWRLLQTLEARRFDVFGAGTARLSRAQKLALIGATWFRLKAGPGRGNYGV